MTRTFMTTAAVGLALALTAGTASAQASKAQLDREHARAVSAGDWANDPYDSRSSDDLNRAQLSRYQAQSDAYANSMAADDAEYSSDQRVTDTGYDEDQTVIVQGVPSDNATSSFGQPDTNPQSSGTPMTNELYVQPATLLPPADDDSTGS